MKKTLIFLTLAIISISAKSQIIDERIPKFAEILLVMNKESATKELEKRGFNLYSKDHPYFMLVSNDTIDYFIVGKGFNSILCRIHLKENKNDVNDVYISNVKYTDYKYMLSEYTIENYILDEEKSKSGELYFTKKTKDYTYTANVYYYFYDGLCFANSEITRVRNKVTPKK